MSIVWRAECSALLWDMWPGQNLQQELRVREVESHADAQAFGWSSRVGGR